MEPEPQQPLPEDLRERLAAIERAIDDGSYRPGPWRALTRDIRNSMFFERAAMADDVSRVSRKLHLRKRRRHASMDAGILLEIAATAAGPMVMLWGVAARSNALAFLGALIWMVTFEPLFKLMAGSLMGVRYDYFYLLGIEPRLKMSYGTYLARPRLARIIVHLSGTVGSPLAAYLTYWILSRTMPEAAALCFGALWVLVAINLVNFFAPLLGIERIGPMPLSMSSAGAAALEIREGLGW
ncbi:MAG TPA: hypothetical protein VGH29_05110 [Candidatus Binataceae bacterium]